MVSLLGILNHSWNFSDLNISMAAHKVEGHSNVINFLGITLNTNLMIASLPQEKLDRIR